MSKKEPAADAKANLPDVGHIQTRDLKEVRFPVELAGEYRVHLTRSAADKMKQHADATSEVELCGVLVGDVCKDSAGPYLSISDIIEGKAANNYGSQVTFTHDTWAHINSVMDKQHPGKRIVGWYHTHPGFGVFLSGMDSFIQENFFNQPYQVAIVIETKQDQMGCFAWVAGKSVPLRRLWIGDEEVPLATGEAEPFQPEADAGPEARRALAAADDSERSGWRLSTVLLLLLACLIGWLLGRLVSGAEIQHIAADSVQSEVYSILEYASLNAAAGRDFQDVADSLKKTEELLAAGKHDEALKELQASRTMVSTFASTYKLSRERLRSEMEDLAALRPGLAESVRVLQTRQVLTEQLVKQIVVGSEIDKIVTILRFNNTKDPAALSPQDQALVKDRLDNVLALVPEAKAQIKQALPEVIEYFYPEKLPTTDGAVAPKREMTTSTTVKKSESGSAPPPHR